MDVSAANDLVSSATGVGVGTYAAIGTGGLAMVIALWKVIMTILHRMQMDKSSVMTRRGLDESVLAIINDLKHQLQTERELTKREQLRADQANAELKESIRQAAEARGQLEAIHSQLEQLRKEVAELRSVHNA